MSLTGTVFLDLVALCALSSFVALVVFWPRLVGARWSMILLRGAALLLVNALVLLTAATQLNSQYLFFASWTDLRGALGGPQTGTAVQRGSTAAQAAGRPLAGDAATATGSVLPSGSSQGVIRGGVLTYTIRGRLSGLVGRVDVQLPPGYALPANALVRYPVLETFAGYPGSPMQWITGMNLGAAMADGAAANRVRPALIVSPRVEFPPGVDTECVNGQPGSPQLETWLAKDVPEWVVHTFRVHTERSSWASIGLSTGGWCAAMVSMLHPAQYSAAVVMGGYFHPDFGPLYDPYPENSPLTTRYDLVALARRHPPPVAMWIETSHSDPLSYASSVAMIRATRGPMAVDATVLQNAGHRIGVWRAELPSVIRWLGANIPGFRPRAP